MGASLHCLLRRVSRRRRRPRPSFYDCLVNQNPFFKLRQERKAQRTRLVAKLAVERQARADHATTSGPFFITDRACLATAARSAQTRGIGASPGCDHATALTRDNGRKRLSGFRRYSRS